MSTYCEIKPYIKKLPISLEHKNYINDKHNEIVDALKATKAFTLKNGKLYALKYDYAKSVKAIRDINSKYENKVATLINDELGGDRLVRVNAISLGLSYKSSSTINNITGSGIAELFDSTPELANAVYSKILTNSGLSAENLLSLLLKDNLIEKQCS